MAKKAAVRVAAARDDSTLGTCLVTDPQSGVQTPHLMTKAQCDNTPGGSFLGGPVGLFAKRVIAAKKKTAAKAKKTPPKKSAAKAKTAPPKKIAGKAKKTARKKGAAKK